MSGRSDARLWRRSSVAISVVGFFAVSAGVLVTGAFVAGKARAGVPVTESVPDVVTTKPAAAHGDALASPALNLKYEAYVAGINAGEARLVLERRADVARKPGSYGYRVSGSARSKGLWESMQQWRAQYSVDGVVDGLEKEVVDGLEKEMGDRDAAPWRVKPGHFFSLQTTPKKRREIHIEDGILKETKNHKVRDPRPAQSGLDLLSALFFLPPCDAQVRVHTGRDGYMMRRIEPSVTARVSMQPVHSCTYEVTDEEGGRYQMSLEYSRRGSDKAFVVPSEISVQGPLSGRMTLVEATSATD